MSAARRMRRYQERNRGPVLHAPPAPEMFARFLVGILILLAAVPVCLVARPLSRRMVYWSRSIRWGGMWLEK